MAGSPHKQGLRFFPFEVKTFDEKKIQELIEAHGSNGFMFWFQLKATILSKSNFLLWDRIEKRSFRKQHEYKDDTIDLYLNYCIDNGLLSHTVFSKYQVLTSEDIQGDYLLSCKGRSKVIFVKEYTLINFDDYTFFDAIVNLQTIGGELLERFCKKGGLKVNPETKQPLKGHKKPTDATKPLKEPSTETSFSKYTKTDVAKYISVPYSERPDDLKENCTKDEYDTYVILNKKIDSLYPKVRLSERQMTLPEYLELIDEMPIKPILSDLEKAFRKINNSAVKADTDIILQVAKFIEVTDLPENKETPPPYPVDIEFEDNILSFWDYSRTTHHKKLVLVQHFLSSLYDTERLTLFREQFTAYKEYTTRNGLQYRHKFDNFIGDKDKMFENCSWDDENWVEKLKNLNNGKHGRQEQQPSAGKRGYTPETYGKI